jgi:hypothetical protein
VVAALLLAAEVGDEADLLDLLRGHRVVVRHYQTVVDVPDLMDNFDR